MQKHIDTDLPAFQREAIERIVEGLTTKPEARRFLVADEVGLGKTHIAEGVIEKLAKKKRRRPFTVLYICSNTEIARQNQSKLGIYAVSHDVDRLTLVGPELAQLRRQAQAEGKFLLLSLTPGTSLYVRNGYGTVDERIVLRYLLRRVGARKKRFNSALLRGGVDVTHWYELRRRRENNLPRHLARDLRSSLAGSKEWRQAIDVLRHTKSGAKIPRLTSSEVGAFRAALARAVLECLAPDLIILDEFQRFREVIQQPSHDSPPKRSSILSELIGSNHCPPIILLSATPYPFYPPDDEDTSSLGYLDAFYKVLQFLRACPLTDPWLAALKVDFAHFGKGLKGLDPDDHQKLDALRIIKERIERKLRGVMCRTERNVFLQDRRNGIHEAVVRDGMPTRGELLEFKKLSKLLALPYAGPAQIIDFWKSAPCCVAFTGSHYRMYPALKKRRHLLQKILSPRSRLSHLVETNLKCRKFVERMFVDQESVASASNEQLQRAARKWRYLWCRPTYVYWRDEFFKGFEPTKFLVFSHWKFVPPAIAALLSAQIAHTLRIPEDDRKGRSTLRFDGRGSLSVFDICMPSPALARLMPEHAFGYASANCDQTVTRTFRNIRAECRQALERHFEAFGRSTRPLWQALAEFERRIGSGIAARDADEAEAAKQQFERFRSALRSRRQSADKGQREALKRYLKWMETSTPDGKTRIKVSERQLDRLIHIVASSPALALFRAVERSLPGSITSCQSMLLETCLEGLRHYFATRYTSTIIRRSTAGRAYVEKVLRYCGRGHFEAVIDEFVYLLASQYHGTSQAAEAVLHSIRNAFQVGIGSPRVRFKNRRRLVAVPTHFALAFTDERTSDQEIGGSKAGRHRKTQVREAFNSPFWPFVLATTSVGQEGLDFHLYCRDVVHWNLSTNPVDLEQREGRVNRRNSLLVRRAIAVHHSIIPLKARTPIWETGFRAANQPGNTYNDHRGLSPHWLYEPEAPRDSRVEGDLQTTIQLRRHVLCYADSKDIPVYQRLCQDLALYRLAFGQPRQKDLIASLRPVQEKLINRGEFRFLEQFMFDLSPFKKNYAWTSAREHARRCLSENRAHEWCNEVAKASEHWLIRNRDTFIAANGHNENAAATVRVLIARLKDNAIKPANRQFRELIDCAAGLLYLLNRYDEVFDTYGSAGLVDDVKKIEQIGSSLRRKPEVNHEIPESG